MDRVYGYSCDGLNSDGESSPPSPSMSDCGSVASYESVDVVESSFSSHNSSFYEDFDNSNFQKRWDFTRKHGNACWHRDQRTGWLVSQNEVLQSPICNESLERFKQLIENNELSEITKVLEKRFGEFRLCG
ncbi:hypothetical protein QYM36_004740 [Artemia franciscana]|uniref:Uncharacterized protein n=1 Tax=Artemia franciscana TaxID=6661 RepID=A0AA88I650_ARTSF|nr:hypothetical protein QYM36_004740 [Artemia franciscana]